MSLPILVEAVARLPVGHENVSAILVEAVARTACFGQSMNKSSLGGVNETKSTSLRMPTAAPAPAPASNAPPSRCDQLSRWPHQHRRPRLRGGFTSLGPHSKRHFNHTDT
eukprot:scaffold78756_cov48-Phaeocystis_antarctica.AAC.2